jgi:hypothetical protein
MPGWKHFHSQSARSKKTSATGAASFPLAPESDF